MIETWLMALENRDFLVEARRYLHRHAEVGMDMLMTKEYIKKTLNDLKCDYEELPTGILTSIYSNQGKTILLRADIDASAIKEDTNLTFKSKTVNAHIGGHDFHASMLLGACMILKKYQQMLKGTVKVLFQTSDVSFHNEKAEINTHILENSRVDGAMMIHIISNKAVPSGIVLYSSGGEVTPSEDVFKIRVMSKDSSSYKPLVAASFIHLAIEELNREELVNGENNLIIVREIFDGSITDGVPNSAYIMGYISTYKKSIRSYIKRRLQDVAISIGSANGCVVEIEYTKACPSLIVNEKMSKDLVEASKNLLGEHVLVDIKEVMDDYRSTSVEEFAYISDCVPSMAFALSASKETHGIVYPNGDSRVVFDEKVLPVGAALYANSAIEWLKNN